jgi:protein tyrosine phosphatase
LKKGNKNFYDNNTSNLINKEFETLLDIIDYNSLYEKYLNQGNETLDRYSDIKSYNHNIINIKGGHKYINASPINIITKKYFISTQGPKNETIEDFWTMIEEYECNIIIMLCNIVEGGREKCAKYWDEKNKMNNYSIHLNKEETRNKYIIRELKLINKKSGKEKNLIQIHFTGWPDHGIPDTSDDKIFEVFEEMIKLVDQYKGNGPIVVHCSAGIGRTGVFISMYFLNKEIIEQINSKRNKDIKFSVFNLIRKLKEMRLYLVQNKLAYKFIYLFSQYLLEKYNV